MHPQPGEPLLSTRWMNDHQIVTVAGEIDLCTASALHAYLLHDVGAAPGSGTTDGGDLVVDLSAVTFTLTRLLAITRLDLHFDLRLTGQAAPAHQAHDSARLRPDPRQPSPPALPPTDR